MKKILYRNILNDCIFFFLIAIISSSIIIWVFQAVNYLDLIIEDGRDFTLYLKYTLLSYPKIISKLLPFVFFFSFTYVISKYEVNNELIIFWNIGINKINFVNFFFKFSFLILIMQLILTVYLVPNFQDHSRKLIRESEITMGETLFKPKKFNDTIKNLTIYIEEKDQDNFFKNVYLKKDTDKNSFQITFAKKGNLVSRGNQQFLELYDGETINKKGNQISNFSFSKSDFYFIDNDTGIFKVNKLSEMPTLEIMGCLNNILKLGFNISNKINENSKHNCSKKSPNALKDIYEEIYQRIVIPLYLPLLMLISQLIIIKSKEYKNYFKIKILIFLLGFFIIIFSEASVKLVESNFSQNIKIAIFPLSFILLFYFYLYYIFRYRFSSKIFPK